MYCALQQFFGVSPGAKTGNTFANMSKGDFSGILLLYSEETVRHFHYSTEMIFRAISSIAKENKVLIELRDWLLPMLMNGQVSVSS